jgi:hypothetical protein
MTAGRYNITIEQGATFALPVTVSDIISGSTVPRDLTGYTARMKIKENVTDDVSVLFLHTSSGEIVIAPNQVTDPGELSINLAASVTASLTIERGVYDFELVTGSVVERLLEGKVRVRPEVTD